MIIPPAAEYFDRFLPFASIRTAQKSPLRSIAAYFEWLSKTLIGFSKAMSLGWWFVELESSHRNGYVGCADGLTPLMFVVGL
jgi:hypothetical protein